MQFVICNCLGCFLQDMPNGSYAHYAHYNILLVMSHPSLVDLIHTVLAFLMTGLDLIHILGSNTRLNLIPAPGSKAVQDYHSSR